MFKVTLSCVAKLSYLRLTILVSVTQTETLLFSKGVPIPAYLGLAIAPKVQTVNWGRAGAPAGLVIMIVSPIKLQSTSAPPGQRVPNDALGALPWSTVPHSGPL